MINQNSIFFIFIKKEGLKLIIFLIASKNGHGTQFLPSKVYPFSKKLIMAVRFEPNT